MDIIKHRENRHTRFGNFTRFKRSILKEFIYKFNIQNKNNKSSIGNGMFKRYKESQVSNFYIEEIIYNSIKECKISILDNVIVDDLENIELFKGLKTYKQYIEDELSELICVDNRFIIICQRHTYIISSKDKWRVEIMLPNNEMENFFRDWISTTFKLYREEPSKKTNINILKEENKELKLVPIDKDFIFEKDNYPIEFEEVHNKIVRDLEKDKGILLLHGEPGTGKTSYIKCLPQFANKTFIFIPPSFGEILVSPSFLSFMMNHKNSILIIEDAESILKSRKGGQNHAVSNILNLTDGILAEMLSIQIICSLNCNINQIDEAILRPGRLLREHSFGKLSIDKSNELLSKYHPNESYNTNVELTLAEIYNYQNYKIKDNKIGFNR